MITMQEICCCTFIGSRSLHLAPCFSTLSLSLSLDSRSLSCVSVFIRPALAHLPPNPEIQKEMSFQLGKEEDAARSSFRSSETWHDKWRVGKHSTVVTFTSTSEFSATQLPALCMSPPHESLPVMLSLDQQKISTSSSYTSLFLACLSRILDTESWETWESERAGRPKLPTIPFDKLHCCLCCCGALSRSDRQGRGQTQAGEDKCQVQIWVLRQWCNGR